MKIRQCICGFLSAVMISTVSFSAYSGVTLTGGGALLRGLEDLIAAKTGINAMTADDPMTAVAIGTGRYVEFLAGHRSD